MQLRDLPPELFLWIFSHLPYFSLISASTVCCYWRTLIDGDISLRQRMFKAGEDCSSPDQFASTQSVGGEGRWEGTQGGIDEEIQFHPALSNISYRIGDVLDDVEFLGKRGKESQKLIDLEISNDLASIPPKNAFKIAILPLSIVDKNFKTLLSIHVTVTNPNGVRLQDIFSTMILESRKRCDLLSMIGGGSFSQRLHSSQAPGLFMKASLLGDRRFWPSAKDRKPLSVRFGDIEVVTCSQIALYPTI